MRRAAPNGPLEEWRAFLVNAPADRADAPATTSLIHGDFAAEHVLYDPTSRSITGVVDWSDITLGDPALDLTGVLH